MNRPSLIQIGNRILNLNAVQYLETDGPQIVRVHLSEGQELEFIEAEAEALMAVLRSGYLLEIKIDEKTRFDQLVDALQE